MNILGFVEQGRTQETGNNLIAEFPNLVPFVGLDRSHQLKVRGGVNPFLGPTVIHNVAEDTLAQSLLVVAPLLRAGRLRQRGDAGEQELLHLQIVARWWLDNLVERLFYGR